MLQHLHAGHHIILPGMFCRVLFHGFLHIIHLNAAFQRVQFCHLQWLKAHIQTGHRRAFARHTLGQNAAATTDIEHLFAK